MTIEIITTGGTIDKTYLPLEGSLAFTGSYIEKMLARGNCKVKTRINHLLQLDSLDMQAADRQRILEAVRKSDAKQMLITHGTDTLPETAKLLAVTLEKESALKHKTLVLTGAMIPYSINESDALFNLGSALLAVQTLPAGCYAIMNGQVFSGLTVRKNRDLGCFEAS